VAIALDLSGSTYNSTAEQFNTQGTIMYQEVQAVKAYLDKNTSGILPQPNQVQIFGFATGVRALTEGFQEDGQQIKRELEQALNSNLIQILGDGTNIDLAIQEGTDALDTVLNRCRELLVVSDGEVSVDSRVIQEAVDKKVRINAIVIGADSPEIKQATAVTRGIYVSGEASELNKLFTEKLFSRFNNNLGWVFLWLGLAWIGFMWMLVMPLDRWFLQGILQVRMDLSGKLALGNAWFGTALTPIILWQIYRILNC
jgi:Ca-activated chloride channel family protein